MKENAGSRIYQDAFLLPLAQIYKLLAQKLFICENKIVKPH